MSENRKPIFAVFDEYELLTLWRLVSEGALKCCRVITQIWGKAMD